MLGCAAHAVRHLSRLTAAGLILMIRLLLGLLLLGVALGTPSNASAKSASTRKADDPIIGSRLLHYRLRCHPGQRCEIECHQAGHAVISRVRIESRGQATLVMTDGFSDRLQALWLELVSRDGSVRTILLPRDALCDLQGITVEPLAPSG